MQTIADVASRFAALREQLDRVIIGQERVKTLAITSLIAGGHILLEGAPGTGKTLLALALSRLVGCRFRRIQFTPDLMPADLLGANIFSQKSQEFALRPGPVFTDVLLADEINLDFPAAADESRMLEAYASGKRLHDETVASLQPMLNADELFAARRTVAASVRVEPQIITYIQSIVAKTRTDDSVQIGAGPR